MALIKDWDQDGFEFIAYTEPDNDASLGDYDFVSTELRRDYRNGYCSFVGVIVEAKMFGIKLGEASVWSVLDYGDGYPESVIEEHGLDDEALEEALDTLERLVRASDQLAKGEQTCG